MMNMMTMTKTDIDSRINPNIYFLNYLCSQKQKYSLEEFLTNSIKFGCYFDKKRCEYIKWIYYRGLYGGQHKSNIYNIYLPTGPLNQTCREIKSCDDYECGCVYFVRNGKPIFEPIGRHVYIVDPDEYFQTQHNGYSEEAYTLWQKLRLG